MFQVLFKYRLCHLPVNNICRFLRISQLLRTLNRAFPMETVRKTQQVLWDLLISHGPVSSLCFRYEARTSELSSVRHIINLQFTNRDSLWVGDIICKRHTVMC